ncbi:MAG: aldo/keto reductase [Pirellulaceae bacterium]
MDTAVRQGKALYVGISSYTSEQTRQAAAICREMGYPRLLIHQPNYSMFNRWIEKKLLGATEDEDGRDRVLSLFQGLLTGKYLSGQSPRGREPASRGACCGEAGALRLQRRDRARAQRAGPATRPVSGSDGRRLDPPRPTHHERVGGGESTRADSRELPGSGQSRFQ